MSWVESFSMVMRCNMTALREKFEDPERMLHQLIIDMEEEYERVRQSVAGAIADEILLRRRLEQARREAAQWMERAERALRNGDEERSSKALDQRARLSERIKTLDSEHDRQREQTATLQRSVADLEDKIRQAKQKQTLLLARLARTSSQQKINSALRQAESRSAFAQFSRLEQRVEKAEALEEAYDRLEGRDPDAAQLEREMEAEQRRAEVAAELQQLKDRLADEQ